MHLSPNHSIITLHKNIDEIIKPLKQFHITHFDYCKSYSNGSRISLTNNPRHLLAYLSEKHYLEGSTEAKPELYAQQVVLCSTLPKQKLFHWARSNFNIDHVIYFIRPYNDFCEFFCFGSTVNHPEVINFYLNNLDLLQRFIDYFKREAAPLIKQGENDKITLPFTRASSSFSNSSKYIGSLKQLLDIDELVDSELTSRQLDCAKLLLMSKSNKEIATHLNLSPRTIEFYINNIKTKLQCKRKTQLIIKLSRLIEM